MSRRSRPWAREPRPHREGCLIEENKSRIGTARLIEDVLDVGRGTPGRELAGSELPGSELAGSEPPGSELAGSEPPGSELAGCEPPGSELVGPSLSGSELAGSQPTSEPERLHEAIGRAYRYLNRRERTQAEVRAHLESAGFDSRVVEQAIAALVEDGQLDDARFARLFAQDKRELEGWGSDRIRQVLLTRGVETELIEGALAEQGSGDELERALELLRRRFPTPAADRRERDRALGVLLRKGYDVDLALDALAAHAREETR
jgi:regulatory protein